MSRVITAEEWREISRLYDLGFNDVAIGMGVGCSHNVVFNWRKKRGLTSNYVKQIGMPAPYHRENFEGVFNYKAAIDKFFFTVGAETHEEKTFALITAAKEMRTWEGR